MTAVFGRIDPARVLDGLRRARVNYDVDEVVRPAWTFDTLRTVLTYEDTGPPQAGGSWDTACRLLEGYEFSDPSLVRAVYDPEEPLLGRTMLLQARFYGLHFYCGVRVTSVSDEAGSDGTRTWGWSYETLDGHLERGRITYEVVKHESTGMVEFGISSYSQTTPTIGPVVRLGWRLFGRRTQLRFYRECGVRLQRLIEQHRAGTMNLPTPARTNGLVLAPSDARPSVLDRIAVHRTGPG